MILLLPTLAIIFLLAIVVIIAITFDDKVDTMNKFEWIRIDRQDDHDTFAAEVPGGTLIRAETWYEGTISTSMCFLPNVRINPGGKYLSLGGQHPVGEVSYE